VGMGPLPLLAHNHLKEQLKDQLPPFAALEYLQRFSLGAVSQTLARLASTTIFIQRTPFSNSFEEQVTIASPSPTMGRRRMPRTVPTTILMLINGVHRCRTLFLNPQP